MLALGLDLGTKTIVLARRDDKGKLVFRPEINGFFEFPRMDAFVRQMLTAQKVPSIEKDGKIYALGSKAEKIAYTFNGTLKRPMADGVVSSENEAITVMASIVHGLLGKVEEEAVLYYCIPADAINKNTNVSLHDKIIQLILSSYKGGSVRAFPINEARAIAIGMELESAVSISWGAGMVNVCYSIFGIPVYEFSIVGSGDWVDVQSARQFGYDPAFPSNKSQETPTTIAAHKQKVDLTVPLAEQSRVNQAIIMNLQILIENVVNGIIEGFHRNADKARIDHPIPIVMAGGTASPNGFAEYFKKVWQTKLIPFEVSEITVNSKPLFAVAEGCLRAAELHQD
jgi:hypothetical protein